MESTVSALEETVAEKKTKLERGSEEYNLFHLLVKTVPGFLSLTATKIKQKFPQFSNYATPILNTALQNAKRTQKRWEEAAKRLTTKDTGEVVVDPVEVEKSELKKPVTMYLLSVSYEFFVFSVC